VEVTIRDHAEYKRLAASDIMRPRSLTPAPIDSFTKGDRLCSMIDLCQKTLRCISARDLRSVVICLRSILVICVLSSLTPGQPKEKPKLKDFGSSLNRMKWDPEQKAAVEIKSKRDSQTKPDEGNVVQIETSLVSSDVLVLDGRGIPVAGLTDKDFVVTEDGVAQKIGMFSPGDDVKLARSIVLIIDYHCAQLPFLSASVAAAKTLIDKLVPGDRMAIVTDDVEVLAGYTNNKRRLKDSLDELIKRTHFDPQAFFEGRNHLPLGRGFDYSALMAVLREAFDDEDQRPIIIFQTDGEEAELLKDPIVCLPCLPVYRVI